MNMWATIVLCFVFHSGGMYVLSTTYITRCCCCSASSFSPSSIQQNFLSVSTIRIYDPPKWIQSVFLEVSSRGRQVYGNCRVRLRCLAMRGGYLEASSIKLRQFGIRRTFVRSSLLAFHWNHHNETLPPFPLPRRPMADLRSVRVNGSLL